MRLPNIQLPKIPEEAKTPFILELVEIIEQLSVANLLQAEQIQLLRDEIARLKGQKPKPNIQPSKLEKDPTKKETPSSGKRPGSSKREKTPHLVIHEEIRIRPESVPEGSILKDIQPYSVQGLKIQPYNICYLLERWQTPDGRNIVDKLPSHVQLERPEIPLHNNLSESDIREYVKRRKISGSTRSELGRRCRDTFTSLKKTCRKLGVSFWNYLLDRLSNATNIPPLHKIIAQCANPP